MLRQMRFIAGGVTSLGLGAATVLVVSYGCDKQLPGDEVCRDVAYSISNKTFECTGDAKLSNDRYETFMGSHSCLLSEDSMPSETHYTCSSGILRLTCDQVARYGENFDRWLGNAGAGCKDVYTSVDGGALPIGDPVADAGSPKDASPVDLPSYKVTLSGELDTKRVSVVCEGVPKWNDMPVLSCVDTTHNVRVTFSILNAYQGVFQGADVFNYASLTFVFNSSWDQTEVTAVPTGNWTEVILSADSVLREESGTVSMRGSFRLSNTVTPTARDLSIAYDLQHVPCGSACK